MEPGMRVIHVRESGGIMGMRPGVNVAPSTTSSCPIFPRETPKVGTRQEVIIVFSSTGQTVTFPIIPLYSPSWPVL